MVRFPTLAVLAAVSAASAAQAQSDILIAQGDVLPGVGTVADVFDLAVGEDGRWAASVMLEGHPFQIEHVLVVDGQVALTAPLQLPGRPEIQRFGGLAFDANGELTWLADWMLLGSPSQDTATGAYVGTAAPLELAAAGQPMDAAGLPAGWTIRRVHQLRPGAPNEWWVSVEGDFIPGGPPSGPFHESAVIRYELGPGGLTATAVVKAGDVLSGLDGPVHNFSNDPFTLAANRVGQFLHSPSGDHSVHALFLGGTKLVKDGEPSILFGNNWGGFARSPLALNDAGVYAFGAQNISQTFPGTWSEVLIRSGALLARTGDTLPQIAPFVLDRLFIGGFNPTIGASMPAAPLQVTEGGETVWFGGWNSSAGSDLGIFVDHDLVLTEGELVVDGLRVVDFLPDAPMFTRPMFDVDRAGDTFALRGRLDDGRIAAVRVVPAGSATAIAGCAGNLGTLTASVVGGPGGAVVLQAGGAQAGATGALAFLSLAPIVPGSSCGVVVPGVGELLVSPQPGALVATIPGIVGSPPTISLFIVGGIPPDPLLAGLDFFAQAVWIDVSPGAPEPLRLTNALAIQLAH